MATTDEQQYSKESVLLVDDAAGTPLLYRQDTPALTAESILERSRRRCAPVRSPFLDNLRQAANAGASRLSTTGRAIHQRATDLALRVRAATRPASGLPAAYRRLQTEFQRPRPRAVRLMTAGGATLVLLVVLALVAPRPRRTALESQSPRSAALPAVATVALESPLADRNVAGAPSVGPLSAAEDGPVSAVRGKASAAHTSDSPRRTGSPALVGTLLVDSEPSGAEVLINGVPHGLTPLEVSALPVGSRVIRLELPGYEHWSWAVNIVADKRTPLRVKLQPAPRRTIPGS